MLSDKLFWVFLRTVKFILLIFQIQFDLNVPEPIYKTVKLQK